MAASTQRMHQVREGIVEKCVDMLAVYRKFCASSSASGQLILPESLKLLPLYGLSLTKTTALRAGADIKIDERAALIAQACRLSVAASISFVYPTLYELQLRPDEYEGARTLPPPTIALSTERFEPQRVYILDSGLQILVWFGRDVPTDVLTQLLDTPSLNGVDCSQLELQPPEAGPYAAYVDDVLRSLGSVRGGHYPRPQIVTSRDPLETRFLAMLTEDRSQAAMSYVEFLCHVHRQIQTKLT
mmetsp:Transcript_6786/g.17383  ORF Transcript_6786/g.17383 Transcript_6786/m.17383 type:complete len:244 (+) Transcript_6786:2-733(+)